jgi:hypothetical protein
MSGFSKVKMSAFRIFAFIILLVDSLSQLVEKKFRDNNLFHDLVASIKEAGAIKRSDIQSSRVTEL